jgi:group II intron reverse transcriptase/maturase
MAKSALTEISSLPYLRKVWLELFGNARAASRDASGVDGVSLNDFATNHIVNLTSISEQLRNGTYKFSPLRPHFVLKPNGKERVICIPVTADRVVQAAILRYLTAKYVARLTNDVSYGFLKGRTVQKAIQESVRLRLDYPWVFKTDIQAFFDNIPRDALKSKLKRFIREPSLHALLYQIIDCELKPSGRSERKRIAAQGIVEGMGVRQGMAVSPFLSNVILERFDKSLMAAKIKVIRYADDLIFFAKSREGTEQAEKLAVNLLAREGFSIPSSTEPQSKSVHCDPGQTVEFLGAGIVRRSEGTYIARVMPNQITKIRQSFFEFASADRLLARRLTLAYLGRYLNAKRSGYIHAYEHCENIKELEISLNDIQVATLKKIYQDVLLIPVSNLEPSAYRFLGISI